MKTQGNKGISNSELLRQYQTEAEDSRTRKIQAKSNKITEERQQINQINDQLQQESQTLQRNRQNHINAQRQDYDRFMTEKLTRQKSGDYRKKTSEPQGTFKIGGDNREIKRKNKDDLESYLPLNPTRNAQLPTQLGANQRDNAYHENLTSNANVVQQNRNRSQGYNIISGQASQISNARDYATNEAQNSVNTNPNAYGGNKPETPKLRHNVQTKANNASYNPISHTDNTNYYSNSVSTNANANLNTNNYNSNPRNAGGNNNNNNNANRNFNIINNNNFVDDDFENKNKKNLNVNNNNNYNYNYNNNQRAENLQYEEDYDNIVSGNANKDYRVQESEGNEYEQAEKFKNLTDEEKRKLYEEYMRKYGAQGENEEENYDQKAYGKEHEYEPKREENEEQQYDDYYAEYKKRHYQNENEEIIRNIRGNLEYAKVDSVEKAFDKLNLNDPNSLIKNKPSYHNMQSTENQASGQTKLDQQRIYREYLAMQVNEKNSRLNTPASQYSNQNVNSENTQTVPSGRLLRKKNQEVQENPYSRKNFNIGGSNLSSNPITNPVDNYNFSDKGRKHIANAGYDNSEMSQNRILNLRK